MGFPTPTTELLFFGLASARCDSSETVSPQPFVPGAPVGKKRFPGSRPIGEGENLRPRDSYNGLN